MTLPTSDALLSVPSPAVTPPGEFLVVGVGASAGGLAATNDFLASLGPAPGVALVIIHHLDPTHESNLAGILARNTGLPVESATQGTRVAPNHVYVVPPNSGLTISNGVLNLVPRPEGTGLHLPIDQFLVSLAQDQQEHAVAVVLSGSGSDGAAGVRAIKAQQGATYAQDASAEYRSMPDAAVNTGCVDRALPPSSIAREILVLAQRQALDLTSPQDEQQFHRILQALRRTSGIDFANYKHSTLRRRVLRRGALSGLNSLREYANLVETQPKEAQALCDEVLIHVTGFFREPDTFDLLQTLVFPKLLGARQKDAGIRVWVPACSSGEEVYSLAMCLLEFLGDNNAADLPIKVFGTDVSAAAIEKARAGTYPASIQAEVSPGRLQRFFSAQDGVFQIRKDVRDLCVFARHDATRDPPFAGLDLVSCRNLMIYLGPALQDRLLRVFHYALHEPGFLLLGASETVRSFPGFATLDPKNKIFARTSAVPRSPFLVTEDRHSVDQGPAVLPGAPASGPMDVQREADRLVLAEFAPPGVVITEDHSVVQFRGRTGQFLEPAAGAATFDLLRMVREELRVPLRQLLDDVRASHTTSQRAGVSIQDGPNQRSVSLRVIPLRVSSTSQRFYVVLFEEVTAAQAPPPAVPVSTPLEPGSPAERVLQELASTRDYLQSVVEQLEASNEELKAANEEIVSSNEELRSTNEELQMAKEELQATNEELRTVNEEMRGRNVETTRLSDDLTNVLSSVEIAILMLGRDSRLCRYTPAAAKLFRLGARDLGRPLGALHPILQAADLPAMTRDVLDRLVMSERTVQDQDGHWYQVTVRPYVTVDNRIDGTVVAAVDVQGIKQGERLLAEARRYAESVVDTVRESLVVLDRDLRVRSANRAFQQAFGASLQQLEGRLFGELSGGVWNDPLLLKRLDTLGDDASFVDVRVEQRTPDGGQRVFLLNARRINHSESILLALEDVTDRELATQALRHSEAAFREMLTTASEAILMADAGGLIVFGNLAAARAFGFVPGELVGLPLAALLPSAARPGEGMGIRKDSTRFPVEVTLGSLPTKGQPLVVVFINDVSQLRRTQREIETYQAQLKQAAFDAAVAQERERRRIAVDLHDRIGQALALAQIKLTTLRAALDDPSRTATAEVLDLLAQCSVDTRTLTFELSPPVLYDLGLKDALAWLADDVEKTHGLRVDFKDDSTVKPLEVTAAALVFRAVREVLLNVAKHARSLNARMVLERVGDDLQVVVQDDGVGFTPGQKVPQAGTGGFGLFSVREQIGQLGGTVDVDAAPGQGTRVTLRVPVSRVGIQPNAAPKGDA